MMRKIQLSVMLIALCLLFATYASALTPRYPPHWNPRKLLRGESELLEHESQFPSTKWKKIGPWIGPRHLVGKKIAGIGQAAANIGAIRNLFLDDDEVGVEDVDWRQGPWIVHHPGGLRGFSMSDAEAEGIDWRPE